MGDDFFDGCDVAVPGGVGVSMEGGSVVGGTNILKLPPTKNWRAMIAVLVFFLWSWM